MANLLPATTEAYLFPAPTSSLLVGCPKHVDLFDEQIEFRNHVEIPARRHSSSMSIQNPPRCHLKLTWVSTPKASTYPFRFWTSRGPSCGATLLSPRHTFELNLDRPVGPGATEVSGIALPGTHKHEAPRGQEGDAGNEEGVGCMMICGLLICGWDGAGGKSFILFLDWVE